MGVVYKAIDYRMIEAHDERHAEIALKVLGNEFRRHPKALIALQREARKAKDLAHPNIVKVFDFDKDGGHAYMTMEYLVGAPLDQYIKNHHGGQTLEAIKPLIQGIAEGLAYAHSKGIVHSDFKPSNVFIHKPSNEPAIAKIFDFGIARAAKMPDADERGDGEKTLFDAGEELGAITPSYASLEMLSGGQEPHPADDIYAFACIVHELLTGRHPFTEPNNPRKKIHADQAMEMKLKPRRIKQLTRHQWRVLRKAMEFEQKNRYHDVRLFAQDFFEDTHGRLVRRTIFGIVGTAALLGGAWFPLQDYLENQKIEEIRNRITDGSEETRASTIQTLLSQNPEHIREVLGSQETKGAFEDFIIRKAQELVDHSQGKYRYPEALQYLDSINNKLESNRLYQQRLDLASEQKSTVAKLSAQYTERLTDPETQPTSLVSLRQAISEASPGHDILSTYTLESAYLQEIQWLEKAKKLDEALALSDEAATNLPNAAALENLHIRISGLIDIRDKAKEIAQTRERVKAALPTLIDLKDFLDYGGDISALRQVEPENEILAQIDQTLAKLLSSAITEALQNKRFPEAEQRLDRFSQFSEPNLVNNLSNEIEEKKSAFNQQIRDLFVQVERAVNDGRLVSRGEGSATNALAKLRNYAPDHPKTDQAASLLSKAVIDNARNLRGERQWDKARNLIEVALSLDLDGELQTQLQNEMTEVDRAAAMAEQQLAAEERAQRERERTERINTLQTEIDRRIREFDPAQDSIRPIFEQLDKLAAISPTDPFLESSRSRLATAYSDAARQAAANGAYEAAIKIINNGAVAIPESELLSEQAELLAGEQRIAQQEQLAEKVDDVRRDLERLLSQTRVDEQWEDNFRKSLRELESLAGEDAIDLESYRQRAGTLFVEHAAALTLEERFDEAAVALDKASNYTPNQGEITTQKQRTEEARTRYNERMKKQEQLAKLEGLKQTFSTQLDANELKGAEKTLATLASPEWLGGSDPFVTTTAPRDLADRYATLAKRSGQNRQYGEADALIKRGLEHVPNHPELQALAEEYRIEARVAELQGLYAKATPRELAERLGELQSEIPTKRFNRLYDDTVEAVAKRLNALAANDFKAAHAQLIEAREIFQDAPALKELNLADPRLKQIRRAIESAELSRAEGLLTELVNEGEESGELDQLARQITEKKDEAERLLADARPQQDSRNFGRAEELIASSSRNWRDNPRVETARNELKKAQIEDENAYRRELTVIRDLADNTTWTISNKNWEKARTRIATTQKKWQNHADELRRISKLLEEDILNWNPPIASDRPCTTELAGYGAIKRGICYDMLSKESKGPWMVVTKAGDALPAFAISLTEIAIRDYNSYCDLAGTCSKLAGNDLLPATGLDPQKIEAFADWLSKKTRATYRLPTEEEWRHAASPFANSRRTDPNCRVVEGSIVVKGKSLVRVDLGDRNDWGLYQTLGNAAELVRSGGSYSLQGGAYMDSFADCKTTLSRQVSSVSPDAVGFRLLREIN